MEQRPLPKLDVNATNRCNLRCSHCCFDSGRTKLGEMMLVQIRRVLHEFKALGGQRIDVTGGEPLTRFDLRQILRMALHDFALRTELVTNSLLATDEMLEEFSDLGLAEMAVSIDGSTPELHASIRHTTPEQFAHILARLETAAKLGIKTKVNTVVFATNLADLKNITALAISVGASEHGLYFFSPIGRGKTMPQLVADPVAWLRVIREELAPFADKIKLSLEVPCLETEKAAQFDASCFLSRPWHLQILPDGNVYPCAIMAARGEPIGNLHEESLAAIWHDQSLWNGAFFQDKVRPLFERFGSCVDYPRVKELTADEKYTAICLCKKLSVKEVGR